MAATKILRIKSAQFDTTGTPVAIDGAVSIEFSQSMAEAIGRSDDEHSDSTVDTVGEGLTGTLNVSDEDVDLTLLTGDPGVLLIVFYVDGGTTKTLTLGRYSAGVKSGVVFTSASVSYNSDGGPTPVTALPFELQYETTNTGTFGTIGNAIPASIA